METAGSKRKRAPDTKNSHADEATPRTIFLEGLPYTATEDDIITFCSEAGPVKSVRAPRWQDSGRLRGFAHVEFERNSDAKKAIGLDGKYIGGRFIKVAMAKAPGEGEAASTSTGASSRPRPHGCTTLFVRGLPYEADEEAVRAAFERHGAVLSVRIARNHSTRVSKGFGYVQYEHGFAAEAAVKVYATKRGAGIMVGERRVTGLDWDVGAPKASFRAPDGRHFAKTEEGQASAKASSSVVRSAQAADSSAPASAPAKKAKYARRKERERAEKRRGGEDEDNGESE